MLFTVETGDLKASFKNQPENQMTTHTLALEGTRCKVTLRTPAGKMAGDALAARVLEVMAQLKKASKCPTPAAARRTEKRSYPKFAEGTSTADYVRGYTMLNARMSGHGIRSGAFLTIDDIRREQSWLDSFYAPLSTEPQFTPVDEVELELEAA
jgi:hypothetical protein